MSDSSTRIMACMPGRRTGAPGRSARLVPLGSDWLLGARRQWDGAKGVHGAERADECRRRPRRSDPGKHALLSDNVHYVTLAGRGSPPWCLPASGSRTPELYRIPGRTPLWSHRSHIASIAPRTPIRISAQIQLSSRSTKPLRRAHPAQSGTRPGRQLDNVSQPGQINCDEMPEPPAGRLIYSFRR